MDLDIKKDLASNWFKLLQDAFCNDIVKLENHKTKFKISKWKKNPKKNEGGGEYRILKDGKVFDFPRRFSKKKCSGKIRGFSMRSSCAPFK